MNGREYVLEYPRHADYAFIRACRADSFGNLQYRRSQRNFNPIMAQAARTTIVEVEEDILEPGALDPDHVHTPGIFVDRIVKIPPPPEGIWNRPYGDRASTATKEHDMERKGIDRQTMCNRLAMEFQDDWVVNLGIGVPTLCSNFDFKEKAIIFHAENGVVGYGPWLRRGRKTCT